MGNNAMSDTSVFQRNLQALSARNPDLCVRLSVAKNRATRYRLLESKSGELVPALIDASGAVRPLHSTIDPRREAQRLISSLKNENGALDSGFLVFLGLGAGFSVEYALQSDEVVTVAIIDFDIEGIAELLCLRDYAKLFKDPRLCLLIDPSPEQIESFILEHYLPSFSGGIRTLPLRPRTEEDAPRFNAAAAAIQGAVGKVSADYSVQAYFGTRWFSNIIRNFRVVETQGGIASLLGFDFEKGIEELAICAAGPSLDIQIDELAEKKQKGLFIIASDTSLPALLGRGLKPDAIVSIDCQHISYYHFIGAQCRDIPLFLDIASPPFLSGFSTKPFFMSGGHPLARYISQHWQPIPLLDTSGGNVTYACLSLAETLGARRVYVYGADFSYPKGKVYARGTYIYPFFEKKQNRLESLEALFSAFLYRSPFVPPEDCVSRNVNFYYETAPLRSYRKNFEEKAATMNAEVFPKHGMGATIQINKAGARQAKGGAAITSLFAPDKARIPADEFLEQYKKSITSLPVFSARPGSWLQKLGLTEKQVLSTLLPQAAAIKRRYPELDTSEVIETTKQYCVSQLDKVNRN
jgi:hypothetical protein